MSGHRLLLLLVLPLLPLLALAGWAIDRAAGSRDSLPSQLRSAWVRWRLLWSL